jgi:RNA polymerase sigma factor (sigma-70 family)
MAENRLGNVLRWVHTRIGAEMSGDRSDDELLSRYLSRRDEAAFEAILRRHGPLVLGVCRRLLFDAQDVEDAFQTVFLILVRKAASLRRRERLGAWLYGVAHRVAVRARAHAARAGRRQVLADVATSDPAPDMFWQDLRGVLDEEVQRLPEKYRLPVVLCYLEGLTNEEAAQALGWPKGTVATRLARARERLRRRLVRRGLGPQAGALGVGLAHFAQSPVLPEALIQASTRAAAGGVAAVPAPVGALMKGVLRDMFWSKTKSLTVLTLALGLALTAGVLGWQAWAADTPGRTAGPDKGKDLSPAKGDDTRAAPIWQAKGNFKAGNGQLAALALSPDGKTVAVANGFNNDGAFNPQAMAVQLWDADQLKKRGILPGLKRPFPDVVGSLTFSPDGKTLAVGDSTLVLWDTATGKPKCRVPNQGSSLNAVAFSPDGKVVATVRADGLMCIANAKTGKLQFATQAHQILAVSSAAFADDGKTLVTGDYGGMVKLWDAAKGKVRGSRSLKGREAALILLVFAPNGKAAATATGSGTIQVWDLTTGKPRTTLTGRSTRTLATQLAFAPDGATLAVGTVDGSVTLWDLATQKELTTLKGNQGSIHRLTFSAQGNTLANGDERGNVYVWSLDAEAPRK